MPKVSVKFKDRTVLVDCTVPEGESELLCVKEGFEKYCTNDPYLVNKLKTHYGVFEYLDQDFDEKVEVPNMCTKLPSRTLFFRLCPFMSPSKETSSSNPIEELSDQTLDRNCSSPPNLSIMKKRQLDFAEGSEEIFVTATQALEIAAPSAKKKKTGSPKSMRFTVDNFPMPKLSPEVTAILDKGLFLIRTREFVKEVALHLMKILPDPTPKEYDAYVTALLIHFHKADVEVSVDPTQNIGQLLKGKILNFLKNHRKRNGAGYIDGVELLPQRGSIVSLVESRKARKNPNEPGTSGGKKMRFDETTSPEELLALLERPKYNADVLVKALPLFFEERRNKIATFKSILKLVKKWPCFKSPVIIEADFLIRVKLSADDVALKFNSMLEKAGAVLTDVENQTEVGKLKILAKIEEELQVNPGKFPKAITIEKLAHGKKPPKMPNKIVCNAPISVNYIDEQDSVIRKSFLMAESKVICSIESPTAFSVYKMLVGAYYAYHRDYPLVSKNFYDFLDFIILSMVHSENASTKLSKMKRKFCDT